MSAVDIISGGLTALGTAASATGTIAGGDLAMAEAKYKSKQLDQQAAESRAVSQREAMEYRRKGKLALSALQARAAASGGGADDPTIVNLASGIAGRSEYQALATSAAGENKARGYEGAADAALASGKAAKKGAKLAAWATILGGAGSVLKTFKDSGKFEEEPNYG